MIKALIWVVFVAVIISYVFRQKLNISDRFFIRSWEAVKDAWKWTGKYKVPRNIVIIALAFFAYSSLERSQGDINGVTKEIQKNGSMILRFNLPEGYNRIEFLDPFFVTSPSRISFKFDGTLYEYVLSPKAVAKKMPRQGILTFTNHRTEKRRNGIIDGSELEWNNPPYTIRILTDEPFDFHAKKLRYRTVSN